jgi:mRNA guanylyltransferase
MNLQNITFGPLINDKSFTSYITKFITLNYGSRDEKLTFPAPQPASIEKKDFTKLIQYKYFTGIKLDGVRFLMVFIKNKNGENNCIIVNRAMKFYSITVNADENIYNGTILDGEIIKSGNGNDLGNGNYTFVIHDALILCGNKINKKTHSDRLCETKYCIDSFVMSNVNNTLDIVIKDFYPFEEFEDFIENVYNKSSNNDGIIFMPENLPVISGTQYSMLKWKPKNKHTFDFMIKEVDLGLEANVFHMGNLKLFANIHKNTENGKVFIENTQKLDSYKNECIVECTFDKTTNNFTPILVREDKTHPNGLRTIERTLFNITENVEIKDFIELLKKE